jgi:hydroxyacylglutathione hydrolase
VLIAGFPAAAFGTNCYVVAPAAGEECVVVDPGIDVVPQLDAVLAEHRLKPVAVLLTHGHIDHTFSVTPVCGARDVPAYLHPGDSELLADPLKGLSPETRAMFAGRLEWTEPDDVKTLTDGEVLRLAGLEVTVDHAPGHTRGSVAFRLPHRRSGEERAAGRIAGGPASGADEVPEVMFSGDLLFAGSVGRTDLPGGDHATMLRSLATKVLPLRDEVVVLPGHGPQTTIGRERATNPFLQDLPAGTGAAAPGRGL